MRTRFLSGVAVLALAAAGWWLLAAPPAQTGEEIGVPVPLGEVAPPPVIGGSAAGRERSFVPDAGCTQLSVRVVDEHDAPLVGMLVDAFPKDNPYGPRNCESTDTQGTARLSLQPGLHCVTADRGSPKMRSDLWSPLVEVQPGAEGQVCLVMERYSCSVEVRVLDDIGTPLEGINIFQRDYAGGPAPRGLDTDVGGTALFQGVPPGIVWFGMDINSSVSAIGRPRNSEASCKLARDGHASIEYRLPRLATVRFVARGGEVVRVTLGLRYVCGPCQDPGPFDLLAAPDMEPTYLLPGTYDLERFDVEAGASAICRGPLRFEALPGQAHVVELPVERVATRLSIRLQDERGMPVTETHVRVLSGQGGGWVKQLYYSPAAPGRYELLGIPPEPLIVQLDASSCHDRDLVYLGGTDARPWVELTGPVADLLVVLHDAYAIRGTVLDADGQPLSSSEVTRGAAAGCGAGRTWCGRNDHGEECDPTRFVFRCLRPGKYPLWVGEARGRPPDAEVEVGPRATPSRTAEVVLRHHPAPAPK